MDARFIGGPLDGRRRHFPDGEAAVEVVRVARTPVSDVRSGYYRSPGVRHPAEERDPIDFVWIPTPAPRSSRDPEAE